MPELPEVLTYLETLEPRIAGRTLEKVRLTSPSLLRTYDPPLSTLEGRTLLRLDRIGKRIVWELEDGLFAVFHLMITGRFRWKAAGAAVPRKLGLAAFDFHDGTLLLTESGTRKQASLHVVRSTEALDQFRRGGLDPRTATLQAFRDAMVRENRTLKRALTDPRILDGIGNAHSDEILHRARLSPTRRTGQLDAEELERLYHATREELEEWIERRRRDAGGEVPERVRSDHPEMAVHGRYGQPCPRCGSPIQRIRYAANETNYCATCQTGGRLLADRALSRLLGEDWPRSIEELEQLKGR